ncbi:MAG TPA: NnrS family protein [Rhizomicrobium sp.]|nr:NnrS family protein [Rhizomicrobium sp.]
MSRKNTPGSGFALFAQGFRPFFLAASLWAVIAIAIWLGVLETGLTLPSRLDPLAWHMHEMLFGFVMAAVAGFLLTAIPNWTGRLPISGMPLAGLAGLWLLGRIACLTSLMMPAWLAIACDLAFPVALAGVVAREIIAGKNWRNLVMLVPVTVLGTANLLMHLEAPDVGIPAGLGWRLGLVAIIFLVTVIGGRIVPSFTRNWLVKQAAKSLPAPSGWPDRAALGFLHAGLFGWAAFPNSSIVAILILGGAGLNLWRLYRWRGLATGREPLLVILHIGYAWVIAGAALLGLSLLTSRIPQSAAIHALTVGASGTMILAVMTRATRGHTGRPLAADRLTSLIYVQVGLAAVARVAAAFSSDWTTLLLLAAAALWCTAFITFVIAYGPMLTLPRRGPPS